MIPKVKMNEPTAGLQSDAGRQPGNRLWLSLPQVFVKVGSQPRDDASNLSSIIDDEL